MGNATVDRVLKPRLGFVGHGDGGLGAVGDWDVQEELGKVAGPEHLVDGGEVGCALLVAKEGGEDAAPNALAPKELASSAWRT